MCIMDLFEEYCAQADRPERLQFALRNPALISRHRIPEIETILDAQAGPDAPQRKERLAELDALRGYIAQNAGRYPAGVGPIEREVARVVEGHTSMENALAQMQRPELAFQLSPIYVYALSWHAEQLVRKGDAVTPVLWMRLLSEACLSTCPPSELNELLELAGTAFIQTTGIALGSLPDGRLLQAADEMGRTMLERLGGETDLGRRAAVLHALGSLYSDPISASTGTGHGAMEQRESRHRLSASYGPTLAQQGLNEFPLPDPKDSIMQAIDYFERALPGRQGTGRGITLKAIAQSLVFLAKCERQPVETARVQQLCLEALPLLAENEYNRRAVLSLMRSLNLPLPAETVEGTAPAPATSPSPSPTGEEFPDEILQRAAAMRATDPRQALKMLDEAAALFEERGSEAVRMERLKWMVLLIADAYAGPAGDETEGPAAEVVRRLLTTADAKHWPPDQLGAALLRVASQSGAQNAELVGLQVLQMITQHIPKIAAYQAPIAFLYVELSIGAAVNAVNAAEPTTAIRHYGAALAPSLRLGLPARVFELLERIADLAGHPNKDSGLTVLTALGPIAFEIDRELGAAGAEALQAVYQRAFLGMTETMNSATTGMILQLAKGARLSAMLRQRPDGNWREDPTAMGLAERIETLRRTNGESFTLAPVDELLLVSAIGSRSPLPGTTPEEELENLEAAFDRQLTDRQIRTTRHCAILRPEIIQELIGKRTVLLDYFLAAHTDKQRAVYIILYTQDEIRGFKNILPAEMKTLVARSDDADAVLDPLAVRTWSLRQALALDPGAETLPPEARAGLAADFEGFLGTPTWKHLETLRAAGKDHLCIRPYGALRYYPLHLLGRDGADLAQHWAVTYLPSLECLAPRISPERPRQGQALGLTYANGEPFNLPELPAAAAEVAAIARAWKSNPLLDQDVTEASVLAAMQSARYVHLCAHGRHDVGAPLFQRLFVTPDAQADGCLCAYEFLERDLRGLELVSLATCDSALGRFDAGDNLTGLPACLLVAGVSCIVGGLWEISDQAAQIFFSTLHGALAKNASPLDAFRQAQLAVRAACPQARDWAAFCLNGDWRARPEKKNATDDWYIPLAANSQEARS